MGIISTFDPKFKKNILNEEIARYWADRVILIKKSKLFLWIKVLFPFILWLSTLVALIALSLIYINIVWINVTLCVLLIIIWMFPWSKLLKYFLDYTMDFAIVTPESFLRYDQSWFFKRTSKVVDLNHIRSVNVRKSGVINSIFNNWNIIILSDWAWSGAWDDEAIKNNPWEVVFRYVYNPDKYSKDIQKLINDANDNKFID